MDKTIATERETRDFMNVESFSQLPFIRPAAAPPKEKPNAIRLFGKEFGAGATAAGTDSNMESESNETNPSTLQGSESKESTSINGISNSSNNNNNNSETSRKFECHYCCRNFPTSQALGGHQNAHKRERQHAKRAHLQSAMGMHAGSLTEASNIYGFMNYRVGAPAVNYQGPTLYSNAINYPHHSNTTARFYGNHHHNVITNPYNNNNTHHQATPINGSPLALWRIPPTTTTSPSSSSHFVRDQRSMMMMPGFSNNNEDHFKPSPIINSVTSSNQSRFGSYETKAGVQDHHVSLDLHL